MDDEFAAQSDVELVESAYAELVEAQRGGVVVLGPALDRQDVQEDLAWSLHAAHEADAIGVRARVVELATPAAARVELADVDMAA